MLTQLSRRQFIGAFLSPGAAAAVSPTPDPLRRLEKLGSITYRYTDVGWTEERAGLTTFKLSWDPIFTFRYRTIPDATDSLILVESEITQVGITLSHEVLLPSRFFRPENRAGPLFRHELDHVAISTDERPRLVFDYLLRHLPPIRRPLAPGSVANSNLARGIINEEIALRGKAVIRLIQFNYDLLDAKGVSDHGRRPIRDRERFFGGLYAAPNLEAARFPYLDEARDLLRQPEYATKRPVLLP